MQPASNVCRDAKSQLDSEVFCRWLREFCVQIYESFIDYLSNYVRRSLSTIVRHMCQVESFTDESDWEGIDIASLRMKRSGDD